MQITTNFHLNEFIKSNTAIRRGIDNYPNAESISNITSLCKSVLQPLRDSIVRELPKTAKVSVRITSGYRSPELNKAIGGSSSTSDHCKGMAADLELWIDGEEQNRVLFYEILRLKLPFRQMIWEFGDDVNPDWVHIAHNSEDNKGQVLKAIKEGGKTKYEAA